jgi:uncharacterized membrane protein
LAIIFGLAGLFVGLASESFSGVVLGAAAGYAFGLALTLRKELGQLRREHGELSDKVYGPPAAAVEPVAAAPLPVGSPIAAPPPARVATPLSAPPTPEPAKPATPLYTTPAPAAADPINLAVTWLRDYFLGGNTVARVGAVVLFVGVGLLAKYAVDHALFPPEMRLLFAGAVGITLLVLGYRLRTGRPGFAATLQGGAVGTLYLTVFFALKTYALLPAGFAFALLALIATLSGALAVMQNTMALAVLGSLGGFLAPVIASTGTGSHVALFSYYAVLDAAIVAVAWFRAWRLLNLLGFICTFGIGTTWGALKYQPEHFATTEPFLLFFVITFVAVGVLFAYRHPPRLGGFVDGSLVFGTPLVGFGLQVALVRHRELGVALSAAGFGFGYLGLALILLRGRPALRPLVEAFAALGISFATLAIPFALDDRVHTSLAWALEGAGLVWFGVRQQRLLSRAGGYLLFASSIGTILSRGIEPLEGALPLLNSRFVTCLVLALSGVFTAVWVRRHQERLRRFEVPLTIALLAGVWLVLTLGVLVEAKDHLPSRLVPGGMLTALALLALLAELLGKRLDYFPLRFVALAVVPEAALLLLVTPFWQSHPFAELGFVAWALFAAAAYAICLRQEGEPARVLRLLMHAAVTWLAAVVIAWEADYGVAKVVSTSSWGLAAIGLSVTLLVSLIVRLGGRTPIPFGKSRSAQLGLTTVPLLGALVLWSLGASFDSDGSAWPLPYIPFVAPVDLAQLFVLVVLGAWFLEARRAIGFVAGATLPFTWGLSALAFVVLNAVIARTVHHWGGVAFDGDDLFDSALFQASVSIVWTLTGLVVMMLATRRARRSVWVTGAVLLALVVAKLFLVDLSALGTGPRIVSFMVVGVLLLVIGYLAPVPPAKVRPVLESS